MEILKVKDLNVCFSGPKDGVQVIKNLNFFLAPREFLALVGESGSGKTITALSILRLLPQGAKVVSGEIIFEGKDILKLPRGELTRLRGRKIVYIPQDPANSLDPRLTVGSQLKDAISLNHSQKSVEELLSLVKITKPLQRAGNYPHELSGGMKQRILIAMALAGNSKILIADEPTTALDVTVQAQILDLLRDLTKSLDFSTIFITHNLGIVAEYADRVVVMKKGEVIEENNVFGLFSVPRHEYTKSLIESVPRIDREKHLVPDISSKENILSVSDLSVHFLRFNAFGREISRLRAVDEVSFSLKKGESVGLVGESGCGKTTIARAVLRVISRNNSQITGRAEFEGQNIFTLAKNELPKLRRNLQLIIQENATALNPRKSAGDQIMEVFLIHGIYKKVDQAEEAARNLMDQVGVPSNGFERFPAEFSSGERQRLILARALALQPKTLFLDEPVASLDVSVQAKILELLGKLQSEYNLTYLFISHDLSVVRQMTHRILVMYLGKIVEIAQSQELVSSPLHPYSQALISAIPIPDPNIARKRTKIYLAGEPAGPSMVIFGCKFHMRCPRCASICREVEPELKDFGFGHLVACHFI